jgi:hypothetical protein
MVRPSAWAIFWTTPGLQSSPILSLQLPLELIEEPPVGASRDVSGVFVFLKASSVENKSSGNFVKVICSLVRAPRLG